MKKIAIAIAMLVLSSSAFSYNVDTSATTITGLWWNQNESGWGATLTHQYDIIFVTMFVYDGNAQPTWYVASSCAVSGSGCTGTLYRVTGGQVPTSTWSGSTSATSVGNVTLSFSDVNNGTMNYTINGAGGSKSITRQVFRSAAPVSPTVNLSSLNTNETSHSVSYTYSGSACSAYNAPSGYTYTQSVAVNSTTSGANLTLKLYGVASYWTISLQYVDGDSATGFNFIGSASDSVSGLSGTVTAYSIRNRNLNSTYYSPSLAGFFILTLPNGCRATGAL